MNRLINRIQKYFAGESGFTLIEMMVAVFVVAIMIAIIMPHLLGAGRRAQETAATQTERTIRAALIEYDLINHQFPSGDTTAQLQTLVNSKLLDAIPDSKNMDNYAINDTDPNNITVTSDADAATSNG